MYSCSWSIVRNLLNLIIFILYFDLADFFWVDVFILVVAEFKEFKPRLKQAWFQLKLYSVFRDLSRRSIGNGYWRFNDKV